MAVPLASAGGGIGGPGGRRPFAGRRIRPGFGCARRLGQWALQLPDSGFRVILGFHLTMLPYQEHRE